MPMDTQECRQLHAKGRILRPANLRNLLAPCTSICPALTMLRKPASVVSSPMPYHRIRGACNCTEQAAYPHKHPSSDSRDTIEAFNVCHEAYLKDIDRTRTAKISSEVKESTTQQLRFYREIELAQRAR